MLVPGDDPPFVTFALCDGATEVRLRLRDGRELLRRLETEARYQDVVRRILRARQTAYPQVFVVEPADEAVLLTALEEPQVAGRLAELRDALSGDGC